MNVNIKVINQEDGYDFEAYGFIYITTNMVNGRKYIGSKVFSYGDGSKNKWESYLGSGMALKNAINKYGKENFKREIIYIANSRIELEQMETYFILLHDAPFSEEYYNIKAGSNLIGNPYAGKSEKELDEIKMKKSINAKTNWKKNNMSTYMTGWGDLSEERKLEIRMKISNSNKEAWNKLSDCEKSKRILKLTNNGATFKGKSHSIETKNIMSTKAKERFSKMDYHYLNKKVYKYSNFGELIEIYNSSKEAIMSIIGTGKINTFNGAKSAFKRSIDKMEFINGFRYSYGEFDYVSKEIKKRKKRNNPIELFDKTNGESKVFNNLAEVCDFLKCDYNVAYKRFYNGTLYKNRYEIKKYISEKEDS